MPNESEYQIRISTDAELTELRQSQAELRQLSAAATAAGQSSEAFDRQLAEVNQRLGSRAIDLYREHLRAMIETQRAAGADVSALEQQLAALSLTAEQAGASMQGAAVSFDGVETSADGASQGVSSIASALGSLVGGAAGAGLLALGAGVVKLVGLYTDLISRGIEFNTRTADSELAIAKVLKKFQNLDEAGSRSQAAAVMEKIAEIEPRTAATLDGLTQGFLATAAASQSAGISVEQNIDLVGRFANALANASLPAEQLAQEVKAILTGNITADAQLANLLEIDNDTIAKAKEAGNLYGVLVDKIGSLGEAGDSTGVRLSSLESTLDKISGQVSKPVFDAYVEGLRDINEILTNNESWVDGLTSVSDTLVDIGKAVTAVAKALVIPGDLIYNEATRELAELSKANAEQLAAMREQIAAADTLSEKVNVRADLEAAIAVRASKLTDSNTTNRDLIEQQLHMLRQMVDTLDQTAGKVREVAKAEAGKTTELEKQVVLTEDQEKRIKEIQDSLAKRQFDALGLEELNGQLAAAQANIRALFRDAGFTTLPDFSATTDDLAKLATTAKTQAQPALFEQVALIQKLEDAVKKLSSAQKSASEPAKKIDNDQSGRLKEQLKLLEDLLKARQELLAELKKSVPNPSKGTVEEFRQAAERDQQLINKLNQDAANELNRRNGVDTSVPIGSADQNAAAAAEINRRRGLDPFGNPLAPTQPTPSLPASPAPASPATGPRQGADVSRLVGDITRAAENAADAVDDVAKAAKAGFDSVKAAADSKVPEIITSAANAATAITNVATVAKDGYTNIADAAKAGAAEIVTSVESLARSLSAELAKLAGRVAALERRS